MISSSPRSERNPKMVRACAEGLYLGDKRETIPLFAGAMHYWQHSPGDWGPCLDAMKAMGLRLVDTYVPWAVHEMAQGTFDFGERNARLDVARFVRMAAERNLYVIVRPGPHINAELTLFGLPERVVWNRECQARSPRNNPVVLPILPRSFPVPSYASHAFHAEAALWFRACGKVLAPLLYPHGPIVMLQVDNEGSLYFRDSPYDQDYHPDAIALFRNFLHDKYENVKVLSEVWGESHDSFEAVTPPVCFDAKQSRELVRHLDWVEFHEHLLAHAMGRFSQSLESAGLSGVVTTHNFPLGESVTPLNAARFIKVVDFASLDYYHASSPQQHMAILRRTSELAVRSEGLGVSAFGAEVGAGFSPIFPPLDEKDSLYTLLCALAYGLRGFNLYMAVDRDRWIGAPIDVRGIPRRLADKVHALIRALTKVQFTTLRRRAPVRLVVPRTLRRLARSTHAFGPITPSAFHLGGFGFIDSCLEDDFGLGEFAPMVGESFVRSFESALLTRGVAFAHVRGESFEASVKDAAWIVCTTAGGIEQDLLAQLQRAAEKGVKVTLGPGLPKRDGSMREIDLPRDMPGMREIEIATLEDPAEADALVARRIAELGLPTNPVDVPDVHVTVHEDAEGIAKVAFVMNPTGNTVMATVGLGKGACELVDLLGGGRRGHIKSDSGVFAVEVPARTVRMFSVTENPALPKTFFRRH